LTQSYSKAILNGMAQEVCVTNEVFINYNLASIIMLSANFEL